MKITNVDKYLRKHDVKTYMKGSVYFLLGRNEEKIWSRDWFIESNAFVEKMGVRPFKGRFCMRIETPITKPLKVCIEEWVEKKNARYARRMTRRLMRHATKFVKAANECRAIPRGPRRMQRIRKCIREKLRQ